ncbi:hypothetical protein ABZS86_16500 [Streptomyces sp. NPDC005355]|uniref:hypothetical protein n=1 Tax=Streptomyces sp. NPDC005355 TaxID=3157038 RepID=UPI0033ADC19A
MRNTLMNRGRALLAVALAQLGRTHPRPADLAAALPLRSPFADAATRCVRRARAGVSQERNIELRDIARQICESGGLDD